MACIGLLIRPCPMLRLSPFLKRRGATLFQAASVAAGPSARGALLASAALLSPPSPPTAMRTGVSRHVVSVSLGASSGGRAVCLPRHGHLSHLAAALAPRPPPLPGSLGCVNCRRSPAVSGGILGVVFAAVERGDDTVKGDVALLARRLDPADAASERKLAEAVRRLQAGGDSAVEEIMGQGHRGQGFLFWHRAMPILGAIGSDRARQALLGLALGSVKSMQPALLGRAARSLVSSSAGAPEVRSLLASKEERVLSVALLALAGQSLGDRLTRRVCSLLRAESFGVRNAAAKALVEDPNSTLPREKVHALADAIGRAGQLAEAKQRYPRHYYTYAEMEYHVYICSLARTEGAMPWMQQACRDASGVTRQALVAARGLAGDHSALADVRMLLQDAEAAMMRAWAAEALGRIGTRDDVPLLTRLAETDPLVRENPSGPPDRKRFLVREMARHALSQIQERLATESVPDGTR